MNSVSAYDVMFGGDSIGVWWNQHPGAEHFMTDPCRDGKFTDFRDIPFDSELFFSFFPEFDNPETYSLPFLSGVAKQAGMFIKPSWCRELDGEDRLYAYLLTVAHMAYLTKQQQAGLPGGGLRNIGMGITGDVMPGVMTSASVGGVSVSKTGQFQPRSMWESWYYQTPYGRTLLVFLEQKVAAGLLYNGEENIASCLRD